MSEPTRKGAVLTVGRVVLDFGTHNNEAAWNFEQLLLNQQVAITVNGKPVPVAPGHDTVSVR